MKRYYAFALVSAFLFIGASAFCATLLFELFFFANEGDRSLLFSLCMILFAPSALVQLIAAGLAFLGRFFAKRHGERGMSVFYTLMTVLPVSVAVLSYLLLLFAR